MMPMGLYRYEESEIWDVSSWTIIGWFILFLTVVPIMLLVERCQKFWRASAGRTGARQ